LRFFFLLAEHAGKHVFNIDVHLLNALVGDDFKRWHGAFADLKIHHPLIELSFAKLRAELFASALRLLALLGQLCFACSLRRRRRGGKRGQERVPRRVCSARSATSSSFSSRTMSIDVSTRSRTMDSTSRPT